MAISTSVSRVAAYYTRHGLRATARRAALAVRRALCLNGMVLLYYDLSEKNWPPVDFPSSNTVEQRRTCAELSPEDLQAMTSFWNPKLAHRNINERFSKGAVLWLMKSEDRLAGYGWTLMGCTIEPHYFPLGQYDVHLFDFHVFPEFRGRKMNPFLVSHILGSLAAEGRGRAFIEAAEWNQAQLSSLERTPLHRFGYARKWTIFRYTIVCWAGNEMVQQAQRAGYQKLPSPAARQRTSDSVR
jgi:ribosomal protein S18 acetylase RimI-like enzyme